MSPGAAIAGPGRTLGEAELVDLRALFAAGESAETIAANFGVVVRTVERWRKELRRDGGTVRISEDVDAEGGGRAMARTCERCADRPAVVTVGAWDVCDRCAPKERDRGAPTVTARPTGPVEPMAPTDLFRCDFYKSALMARACIERQTAVAKPGGSQTWMQHPKFEHCASGKCQQGALIKLRVGDAFQPPDPQRGARHAAANIRAMQEQPRTSPRPPAPKEEPVPDPFLRRVMEERDRDQGVAVDKDVDALEMRDERRSKELAQIVKQRCACSCGCTVKPQRGAVCFRCLSRHPSRATEHRKAIATAPLEERQLAVAAAIEEQRARPPPPQPPAPPPEKKEETMRAEAAFDEAKVRAAYQKYGGSIHAIAGDLGVAWGTAKKLVGKLDVRKEPAAAAPAPKPEPKPRAISKPKPEETEAAAQPVAGAATETRTRVELPAIKDLPVEYLLNCVEYALRMQGRLAAALAGDDKPLRAVANE